MYDFSKEALHECGKLATLHQATIHKRWGSLPFHLLSRSSSKVLETVLDAKLYAESMGNSGIQYPVVSRKLCKCCAGACF